MIIGIVKRAVRALRRYGVAGVMRNLVSGKRAEAKVAFYHLNCHVRLTMRSALGVLGLDRGIRCTVCALPKPRIASVPKAGYAVRGLVYLPTAAGAGCLVSADVGDDRLSVRKMVGRTPGSCHRIALPPSSAPLALSAWNHGRELLMTTFTLTRQVISSIDLPLASSRSTKGTTAGATGRPGPMTEVIGRDGFGDIVSGPMQHTAQRTGDRRHRPRSPSAARCPHTRGQ